MAGQKGFNSKIEYESTPPGTFTKIANVTRIRPFALKVDIIDKSDMDSPGEYREKDTALKDAGQCVVDLNYDPSAATHTWLAAEAGVVHNFRVTMGNLTPAKTATFNGIIVGVGPELPFDNKMTCSVTIEISGQITFA